MNIKEQLIKMQNEDGSFSDSANKPSLFHTAFILLGTENFSGQEELAVIREKAFGYILSLKDDQWRFSPSGAENFLALAAVAKYKKELIEGNALAHILMLLSSLEIKEGGPYRSSLDSAEKPDLGTNAAIACFLSSLEVELPALKELLEKARAERNFQSQFFPRSLVAYLLFAEQEKEYFFTQEEKEKFFLTEDFCSLLSFLLSNEEKKEPIDREEKENRKEKMMLEKIISLGEKRFSSLEGEIRIYASGEIEKTIRGNQDKQMSLMAYFMRQALGEKGKKFTDDFIAQLGLANIFFWTAFVIYDNFWDEDEEADPKILPTANLYAREFITGFHNILPAQSGFNNFFQKVMDHLDAANTWETAHCRMKKEGTKIFLPEIIPDYGNFEKKYYPAAAHILGPVVMLGQLGYSISSAEVKNLEAYFKNYLIPKQINDDLHDWEEDFRRGHISTVVAMLLLELPKEKKVIDFEKDLGELQKIFWFKVLPKAGGLILNFIDKSKKALEEMESLEDRQPLKQYILCEERIIQKALEEQKNTVELLNTYR